MPIWHNIQNYICHFGIFYLCDICQTSEKRIIIYLYASHAKGYAKEKSDIDLCISSTLSGLKFVGLKSKLQEALHKNIDLIRVDALENNLTLLNDILKNGIKIS